MTKAKRGILYVVWGEKGDDFLGRSQASVAAIHPELPMEVVRLPVKTGDPKKMLLEKARMFDLSPFEETLYLDADTVVMGRLDYGFEKAMQFGIACSICENPWARRYVKLKGDLIEYNTGVLFFSRAAKPLFDKWNELSQAFDSTHRGAYDGKAYELPYNDQGSFAAAIDETKTVPFVLPLNWNFRPKWQKSFFGPIKIWHDYSTPHDVFRQMSDYYTREDAVIQYHPLG